MLTLPYLANQLLPEFSNLVYENLAVFTPSMRESDADERWIFPGKHVYNFRWVSDNRYLHCSVYVDM